MDDCTFCRIVNGDETAYTLYEDDQTTAFLDNDPAIRGHSIVIPNSHQNFLFTDEGSVPDSVFQTVRTLARAMEDAFEIDGVSIFYTTPDLIGEVTHAHVHLLPRYAGDRIRLGLHREPLGDDADEIAQEIRDHI